MIAILESFLQYLIIMILLAAIGVAGAFAGKKLRERKDAKTAAMTAEDKQ
ncbi:MAG: vanadium nitrogenase [Lachnospiraceae bacterium]|nr:vanadium nitrogenase [Lachnospiraceae bacterium]MDD7178617.1 vanadium nitrogenase [bacterium]MDY5516716.1 vanadium nitrogenase [Lachnospiraceae bacterium]